MASIVEPRARVAVKGCHASSKTFAASTLVPWWVVHDPEAIAITTGPGFRQVQFLLWGEIHEAVSRSRLEIPRPTQTQLYLSKKNYALGMATSAAVRFQGWHGLVLVVIDEAPGVDSSIFEAIEGQRAGGDVRILMLGNPTVSGGAFYDAFHKDRAAWTTITIDAFDTPNVRALLPDVDTLALDESSVVELMRDALDELPPTWTGPRPYLVQPSWIVEKADAWGIGSSAWDARVRGKFPGADPTSILPPDWVEPYRFDEPDEIDASERIVVGLDPAGPGEAETAAIARVGDYIVARGAWQSADARGDVRKFLRDLGGPERVDVNVDPIGEGRLFQRTLEDDGYNVAPINVGEAPRGANASDTRSKRETYRNLRAQLFWQLRERARVGAIRGLRDETTKAQGANVHWRTNARGQIEIETKKELARRGVASPDRLDALMLAFATLPAVVQPSVRVATVTATGSGLRKNASERYDRADEKRSTKKRGRKSRGKDEQNERRRSRSRR